MTYRPEPYMLTAGENIFCRRCQARSSRTKLQCGRAAMRGKRVCPIHGGKSTGPRTVKGKSHLTTAALKHGYFMKDSLIAAKRASMSLRVLEDIAIHLGLFKQKTKGRKPSGYTKLNLDDPDQLEMALLIAELNTR